MAFLGSPIALLSLYYRRYIFGLHISFKLLRQQSNFACVLAMSSNVIATANRTKASRTLARASSKKNAIFIGIMTIINTVRINAFTLPGHCGAPGDNARAYIIAFFMFRLC